MGGAVDESTMGGEGTGPIPEPEARSLRDLRAEGLLTIRDLARTAGVAPLTIHEIETGTRTPSPRVMHRLAAALGVAQDDVAEFRSPSREPVSEAGGNDVVARLEAMGYPRMLALRIASQPPVHTAPPPIDPE